MYRRKKKNVSVKSKYIIANEICKINIETMHTQYSNPSNTQLTAYNMDPKDFPSHRI